jgi:hypothetical protein
LKGGSLVAAWSRGGAADCTEPTADQGAGPGVTACNSTDRGTGASAKQAAGDGARAWRLAASHKHQSQARSQGRESD